MQIGELKVRLGVDSDVFKVKDFVNAIGQIPLSVAAGITALTGMSFAITDLLRDTLGLANNLSNFRAQTGLSATELEKWNGVAKQMGLSGDAVQSSIMNIGKAFATLKSGGNADEFLIAQGRLGVQTGSPFAMMQQAIRNAAGMKDQFLATKLLSGMGIDPSLIKVGGLSSSQFNNMASKSVIIDEKGIEQMQAFQVQLASFQMTMEKALVPALVAATPIMGKLADNLSDLVKAIGPSVATGANQLIGNISTVVDWKRNFSVESFQSIVEGFVQGLSYREGRNSSSETNVNVTNNIHSSQSPEELARHIDEKNAQALKKAIKQFNNGGQ